MNENTHGFTAVIDRYLTPVANWMDKEIHLSAIKKAMVGLTPLLIIGSFCLIPGAIPNMIGEENPLSQWIVANASAIELANTVGMGMMALYASVLIGYHLSKSHELDAPGCMSMALIAFLMLAVDFSKDGTLVTKYLGAKGLFASMFGAIVAVELFRWCKKRNFTIKNARVCARLCFSFL